MAAGWTPKSAKPKPSSKKRLAQLRDLRQESLDEQAAANAAQHTQTLATNSYEAGAVSYLDVVTAQTAALQAQRQVQALRTRQLQASVGLLTALGGGWEGQQ